MRSRTRAQAAGLAVTAGLALGLAAALGQPALASQPSGQQAVQPAGNLTVPAAAPDAAAKLLYSQDNDPTGYGNDSQDFGNGNALNNQGADDFTVPTGKTWTIAQVNVAGGYSSSSPAKSETVFFYKTTVKKKVKRKEDIPGALIKEVTLKGKDTEGSFAISGITGVKLAAGHYWVSVQANMSASAGYWYWGSRTKKSGSPSVWENPGGGDGLSCNTWTNRQKCFGTTGRPDFMFALYGSSKG